ncbi:DoxX [Legionella busanensis]|uniref:DoxX n=1 Tax=Legionella busanensis TaxID=190655 RepID=A0A378KAE8_9GAMM|nr:DoxX family protein [Legionella busanensis]STX81686.1 DoxX [Legionella busanensis]
MNQNQFHYLLNSTASPWVILIRLSVGLIFLPEGIQKLIFPEMLGAGRFLGIGIPYPEIMGPFVGWFEIICGSLILLGLFTRLAAIPLIIIMIVAFISTKIPILLGSDWWIFQVRELNRYGFWSFMHESRTDWAMLMEACYLLIVGAGRWSLDAYLIKHEY